MKIGYYKLCKCMKILQLKFPEACASRYLIKKLDSKKLSYFHLITELESLMKIASKISSSTFEPFVPPTPYTFQNLFFHFTTFEMYTPWTVQKVQKPFEPFVPSTPYTFQNLFFYFYTFEMYTPWTVQKVQKPFEPFVPSTPYAFEK
jgi:hypothetical protein